ncbi:MAG: ABC transporter substrate-binding protein [Nitrospirae bacterium]|nr:ABC transporter substrate-binding protein [Nitrospirota bacterium]
MSGIFLFAGSAFVFAGDVVKIGLDYPETGTYAKQGLDEKRAADLAAEEINAAGGIMGKKIQLIYRNDQSNPKVAKENATELFDKEGVPMVFGGSSSAVAIAHEKVALAKNKLTFGTLTYATATTGEEGNRHMFRASYDSYFAAHVLADYMNKNFAGKKYFYITSDYIWGWTTEDAIRKFTNTTDKAANAAVLTKLGAPDFKDALNAAKESGAQVLILSLFGHDMEVGMKEAFELGLKKTMQIVVPNLTLDMAAGAGPEAMEGVIGAIDWDWQIPSKYNYPKGIAFVNKFEEKYKTYPDEPGAAAYVILYQYKDAVERAKTFDTKAVIQALEGYKYTGLKDDQYWRPWDHQSVQTVYAVKCKPAAEVKGSKYQEDYFEIINTMKGDDAAIGQKEWTDIRAKVGVPAVLEEAK